jgi:hypothetical protein
MMKRRPLTRADLIDIYGEEAIAEYERGDATEEEKEALERALELALSEPTVLH